MSVGKWQLPCAPVNQEAEATSDGSGNINDVTVYKTMDVVVSVIFCCVTSYPDIFSA